MSRSYLKPGVPFSIPVPRCQTTGSVRISQPKVKKNLEISKNFLIYSSIQFLVLLKSSFLYKNKRKKIKINFNIIDR